MSYSKIAFDHVQEQRIKVIKSSAGYIDSVNNEDDEFFKTLELSLPEIHDFLEAVEGDESVRKHKEVMDSFKETFTIHVKKVSGGIISNPYFQSNFTKLNSSDTFPGIVSSDCEKLFYLGEEQYRTFKESRLVSCKVDIDATISRNSFN